ncbi:MAG: peptidase M61 [Cyclobacteriaceae bacterium]
MIKHLSSILFVFILTISAHAQSSDSYKVEIDLTATENDQIPVTVYPPSSESDFVEYHMPKIVPGTYSISDFGRFITDFKAYDSDGNELAAEILSTNRWKISNANLEKISYKVHDTRDEFDGYNSESENVVFEPGGTDIQDDKLFVLNTFGVIGYIDGMKFRPYEVSITHQENLFGASALKKSISSASVDLYTADDFNFLADGPIMYSEPDTVSRKIANAEILVAVYSPNNALTAQAVMDNIYDLMVAQSSYLGGELPVDRYAYLITLFDDNTISGGYGALEHSYSSLYYLPENAGDRISQIVRDVAAHEFFHIVTPLNIHSEEIGDFDYIDPKMSEHLWLYEGVTEYSSIHVQARYGLYDSPEIFLEEIGTKLKAADEFGPDISFTEMSRRILEEDFEPLYRNVYQKGALIGMCLDLYLLKYSDGKKDLPWLMQELAKKYGKSTSFKDENLFEVITALTYPEVGEFLEKYVAGSDPLPYKEVLSWAGVSYGEPQTVKVISMGKISFAANEKNQIIVADVSQMNEFGKDLKLKKGDALVNINGDEMTLENVGDVIGKYRGEVKGGDKVYFIVEREKKGKLKRKKLKAKALEVDTKSNYKIEFMKDQTEDQKLILDAWIGSK